MAAQTKEERDANLDALQSAVSDWSRQEVKRVENETKFLRSILKSRGAEDAAALNLLQAAAELGDEIDRFLFVRT